MDARKFAGESIWNIGALWLGFIGAFSAFGLLLALAWLPATEESYGYKLAALFVVAGLAIFIGGFLSGLAASKNPAVCGLVFGLILGLCSFGYILGQDLRLLPFTAAAGFLGWFGGWLAFRRKS